MSVIEQEDVRPGIRLLTLSRPESLNSMSHELITGLLDVLEEIKADRSVRAIVLTGAGRGFCSGLDLTGFGGPEQDAKRTPASGMRTQQLIASVMTKMRYTPQPIISAVNGPAAGGGLALALASDVRVAAASARFNVAFVRIGLSGCDVGVSYLLPRLVGASRAFELMLSGRIIDADEADRIGLVLRVVPDGRVVDAAIEVAESITRNSPFGVWMTKEVMWSNLEVPSMQAAIDLENRTQILTTMGPDVAEAMRAFVEKREPAFEPL